MREIMRSVRSQPEWPACFETRDEYSVLSSYLTEYH